MLFFSIFSRLSIMLILYFVLYLLSRPFSLLQGYFSHLLVQYFQLFFSNCSQFLIMHLTHDFGFCLSSPLQPGHFCDHGDKPCIDYNSFHRVLLDSFSSIHHVSTHNSTKSNVRLYVTGVCSYSQFELFLKYLPTFNYYL